MQNILSLQEVSQHFIFRDTQVYSENKMVSQMWLFQHLFSLSKIILWTTFQWGVLTPLNIDRSLLTGWKIPKLICGSTAVQWVQEAGGFKLPDPHILQRACWIAMKEICSLKIFCSEFWLWNPFLKRDTYLQVPQKIFHFGSTSEV